MITDNAFKKALNVWNKDKLKLYYPVTVKNAEGKIVKEITEICPPRPKKRGTTFNGEGY